METVDVLRLGLRAQSASFRLPEGHGFQPTLPLPPVTALVGLVGAAVGLSYREAQGYVQGRRLSLGIVGKSSGRAKDLWKHRKIKSKEIVSSVVVRELLMNLSVRFFIAGSKGAIEELYDAFMAPRYALTLGTSDDLALWDRPEILQNLSITSLERLENTCVRGDISGNCRVDLDISNVPLNRSIRPPRVALLPCSFSFDKGERRVSSKENFTFVDLPIKLDEPVKGIVADGEAVPLL